jgi:hypothetical protein
MATSLIGVLQMPQWLARTNRYTTNPLMRLWAGWAPMMGILEHVGRRSGKAYRVGIRRYQNLPNSPTSAMAGNLSESVAKPPLQVPHRRRLSMSRTRLPQFAQLPGNETLERTASGRVGWSVCNYRNG